MPERSSTTLIRRHVLVIRLSSLGDIVLTQPVVESFHKAGCVVDLLVHPDYASLGKLLPGISRVITSQPELEPKYDLVLDLHATLRARQWLHHIQARRVVHYHKRSLARRLLVRLGGRRMPWNVLSWLKPDESVLKWYGQAAGAAGLPLAVNLPRIEIPEGAAKSSQQILAAEKIPASQGYAVYAPGAKWATKQWPLEHYIQLAKMVREKFSLHPVFSGSREEFHLCEAAAKACGPAVNLAGKTNLSTLAGVLHNAGLVAANDSGTAHLALAAGAPVLAFFGPTVSEFGFAPLNYPQARVLSVPLACRPCSLHGSQRCPLQHHACLCRITPENALAAAEEIVSLKPRLRKP